MTPNRCPQLGKLRIIAIIVIAIITNFYYTNNSNGNTLKLDASLAIKEEYNDNIFITTSDKFVEYLGLHIYGEI